MSSQPFRQLPLQLRLHERATFENFFPGPNRIALEALRDGTEAVIYLCGPPTSGKSHLLQAACHAEQQQGNIAYYIPLAQMKSYGPEVLEGMEASTLVAVHGLQSVAGDEDWEQALFHLFNRCRERDTRMLFSASGVPHELGLGLADLVSRLMWGPVFQLSPLDDEQKQLFLQEYALRKGLELPQESAAFLLRQVSRELTALLALLDELDVASLAAQRRLTVPFIRTCLRQRPAP